MVAAGENAAEEKNMLTKILLISGAVYLLIGLILGIYFTIRSRWPVVLIAMFFAWPFFFREVLALSRASERLRQLRP